MNATLKRPNRDDRLLWMVIFYAIVVIAIVVLLAAKAFGQCPRAGCKSLTSDEWGVASNPIPELVAVPGDVEDLAYSPLVTHFSQFHWVWPTDGTKNEVYLYRGGIQIGGWSYTEKYYRHYFAHLNAWGPARASAPIEPPAWSGEKRVASGEKDSPLATRNWPLDWQTQGVVKEFVGRRDDRDCWRINGETATPAEAIATLIDDDSHKLWLLAIGSEAARSKFLADFASSPLTKELQKQVRIWSVPADHFSLFDRDTQKPMFDNLGEPSIYLMKPAGEVLYAQNGRQSDEFDALRKADPNFKKPEPKPGPSPQPVNPIEPKNQVPMGLLLIGGSVAVLTYLSRKGK